MRIQRLMVTALLAGALTIGSALTSFADFSFDYNNMDLVGIGNFNLYRDDDNNGAADHMITGPVYVFKEGSAIRFTELTNDSAEFGLTGYGNYGVANFERVKISADPVAKNSTIEMILTSHQKNSDGSPVECGIYRIADYDAATGLMDDFQYIAVANAYNPRFIEITEAAPEEAANAAVTTTETGTAAADAPATAFSWEEDAYGWRVSKGDGTYLRSDWYQSPASGLWYYMDANGYMMKGGTTPDGYQLNADGSWTGR